MKEAFFIVLVIGILIGFTAIRYRREIVAAITIWKQFKAVKEHLKAPPTVDDQKNAAGIQLVKCHRCGKWIPESEALADRSGRFACRAECREAATADVTD